MRIQNAFISEGLTGFQKAVSILLLITTVALLVLALSTLKNAAPKIPSKYGAVILGCVMAMGLVNIFCLIYFCSRNGRHEFLDREYVSLANRILTAGKELLELDQWQLDRVNRIQRDRETLSESQARLRKIKKGL